MNGPVVSDSSPIIALERIGHLDLLYRLFEDIAVPPAVAREVYPDGPPPAWIHVRTPVTSADPALATTLGPGERESILLAVELRARVVVLDDLPARRVAAARGLTVVGTAGIALAAKTAGVIEAVGPLLDQLAKAGFHLSQRVRSAVLRAGNEG